MTICKRIAEEPPQLDRNVLPLLLNEKQTAEYLGVSLSYLRKSRSEGCRLGRTPAPRHTKIDGRVFYKRDTLTAWADALVEREAV